MIINEKYTVTPKLKQWAFGAIILGLVLMIVGLFVNKVPVAMTGGTTETHFAWQRFWANILLSGFYFTAVAVVATAFMCIQYLANGGWYVGVKRILEAFTAYLPVGLIVFLVIVAASFLGHDHGMNALYEWMNKEEVAKSEVLTGKAGYLNMPFFVARLLLYFGIWIWYATKLRKTSLSEDNEPGIKWYNKGMKQAATFLPMFGLTFCFASWDWMMSIMPHWYSTIFGVNVFAASLVATLTILNLSIILLKKNGQLSWVNENHHHDITKFVFAFSIFWTYTWLAQFLLIWYANLPEETPFYLARLKDGWKALFFINLILNFVCPFLLFMTRDAKRRTGSIVFASVLILIGKYTDWYLIIMPNTAGSTSGFGPIEIGAFIFFAGLFSITAANALSKANLVPNNHPFMEESLHHEI